MITLFDSFESLIALSKMRSVGEHEFSFTMAVRGFFTLVKSTYRAIYRRRTLSTKVKKLSECMTSAYQDNEISWMDYDDWMEELWVAADEGERELA